MIGKLLAVALVLVLLSALGVPTAVLALIVVGGFLWGFLGAAYGAVRSR